MKVVVLGGSGVATPELASAIAAIPDRQVPLELVLVGRSAGKLERVAAVTGMMVAGDPLLTISHTTDVEAALDGTGYVINQIRVGGLEARRFDESFPREIGLPGEETTGAGGFANATRSIPVALEYARLIERLAPQALLLSFANPASLVQYAITRYTSVRTLGLCDTPITLIEGIASALGVAAGELVVDYAGMHHFGWVTGLWLHGENVLPQALDKAAEICPDIEPGIVQAIGAIPGPYLRYVFHPDRMLARQVGKRTRAEDLAGIEAEILADYEQALITGHEPTALAKRSARWYRLIIAPVLLALVEGQARIGAVPLQRYILNVVNGQTLPWLPPQAVVETPTLIDNGGIHPLAARPVPAAVQALVQMNCAYEMQVVEAIVERDRAKALAALLLNPMIHTYDQATAVLERAWAVP